MSRLPAMAALLAAALVATTAEAGAPTDQIKSGTDRVLEVLLDPELKKPEKGGERRRQIRAVANEIFDWQETGKRALARHWRQRTPAQREEFSQLFADLIERSYVGKLELYTGEKILYVGEAAEGDQATVRTKLVTRSNTEIPIDYRTLKEGDRWRVYDVVIEGVSLVANYRTQFNRIIQQSGFDELMKKLKTKQDELAFEEAEKGEEAVIGLVLAAGVGKRLAPLTEERPKGLLELEGRSLLARLLDGLHAAGVRETALVVGYKEEMIRAQLGHAHRGMPLRYLFNPAYTRGPLLSLWTGRAEFERDEVVLADGDVLFAPPLLERVIRAAVPNAFLGEPDFVDTGEEQILYARGERVVALRRGVMGPPDAAFETRAEWVGFVKVGRAAGVELAAALDGFVRQGRTEGDYEAALDALLPRHPFVVCPTAGLPWIEIDFPQDLQAAESEVLPRIARLAR